MPRPGVFPIESATAAYQYDRNPNSIEGQNVSLALPVDPKVAAKPTCTSGGPIGIMLNGVLLFNALDAEGRDALAYEIQDSCEGHPMMSDEYHYHALSPCLASKLDGGTGHSQLLGYALDGFGIYGPRGDRGRTLTDADLDACHGRTDTITWDGKRVKMYHYVMTAEYPYSIGCFRGTAVGTSTAGRPGAPGRDRRWGWDRRSAAGATARRLSSTPRAAPTGPGARRAAGLIPDGGARSRRGARPAACTGSRRTGSGTRRCGRAWRT